MEQEYILRFDRPATRWGEALPLGNGRMGLMTYGNPREEWLDLSEVTCFSGERDDCNTQPGSPAAFAAMRAAARAGDMDGVRAAAQGVIGVQGNYGTNLPVGFLCVAQEVDSFSDYIHTLDMEHALATLGYTCGGVRYTRESFVSNPGDGAVLSFAADRDGCISLTVSLSGRDNPHTVRILDSGDLLMEGQALESRHSDGKTGVRFAAALRMVARGGEIVREGNALRVKDADRVLLLLAVHTDFAGEQPADVCLARLDAMQRRGDDALREEHARDFSAQISRCTLRIGEPTNDKTVGEILRAVREGGDNGALTALQFQYGRYLLISSSRENSPLPAHLQGVWNDYVAARLGWTCDMHLDVNTQMNYWPAELTGLSESHEPLLRWIAQELAPQAIKTARDAYGMSGLAAELVSNAWGFAAPYWNAGLAPCPGCGAWIFAHLWDRYEFGQDTEFLRAAAYPILQKSAEFFLEYLFEDEKTGKLQSGPSISPESHFLSGGKSYALSISPTFEIVMIREVFAMVLRAAQILGLEDAFIKRVREAAGCLPEYKVAGDGSLQEWAQDYEPEDPQHRHTSHLLGVYPFAQITPDQTPQLARAALRSMELRLTPEESWEDTGWARSMLLLYSARLWDASKAYHHLRAMQTGMTNPNLMVIHPATRGTHTDSEVYELDGNTGLTSGVAEMLLQSHGGVLHLLPALPSQWPCGEVRGLCARGGLTLNISWSEGKLRHARILGGRGRQIRLRIAGGEVRTLTAESDDISFTP